MNSGIKNKKITAFHTSMAAVTAAIYVALTMITAPISFGPVQMRIAEMLCILPVFTPTAIYGVTIGCFLSNILIGGAVPMDVIFGTFATFMGALGTYKLRNSRIKIFACIPPVVSNAVIVPFVLRYAYGSKEIIPFMMITVGMGEVLSIGVLGSILRTLFEKYGLNLKIRSFSN